MRTLTRYILIHDGRALDGYEYADIEDAAEVAGIPGCSVHVRHYDERRDHPILAGLALAALMVALFLLF